MDGDESSGDEMDFGEIPLGEGLFGTSEEDLDWAVEETETSDDESSVVSGKSGESSVVKRPSSGDRSKCPSFSA